MARILTTSYEKFDNAGWTCDYTAFVTASEEDLIEAVEYYWSEVPDGLAGATAAVIVQIPHMRWDPEEEGYEQVGSSILTVATTLETVLGWVAIHSNNRPDWEQREI